jgi:hypothetical protein
MKSKNQQKSSYSKAEVLAQGSLILSMIGMNRPAPQGRVIAKFKPQISSEDPPLYTRI